MKAFSGANTSTVLLRAMDTAALNHRILANNIANADTPNFTPTRLNFKETLSRMLEGRGGFALRTDHPRHFDFTEYRPDFERIAFLSKNDYNKVDLDEQMASLSENTSQYTTYARLLSQRFQATRSMLNDLRG